jgi:hypothetical protein
MRRKTKSLHCPQLDHHDVEGLAGHKAWRAAQTIMRRYKRPLISIFQHFYILHMGPVCTENFNDFTIFIFVLSLITCVGDHSRSTDVKHIISLHQIVYVQRIRCIKDSP